MANYTQRRMVPADALLFDTNSNLAGLRAGTSGNQELYGLNKSQYEANQAAGTDWASRPAATSLAAGTEILLSGVGSNGWTRWRTDGSVWRLAVPTDIVVDLTNPITGAANTSEQILKQYLLPAGVLTSLRYFSVKVLSAKSGAAETATLRIRVGSLGTTSDAQVINSAALAGANRVFASESVFFASSATQLRLVPAGFTAAFAAIASSGVTYPNNTSVSDMAANATYVSVTETMSVGAETATVAHVIITGY